MAVLHVDGLDFDFPNGWDVSKYDEWTYYRNQFSGQMSGLKAVDIIAVTGQKTAYLIEVKDYRHPHAVKPSDLPQAVAEKVVHTLAAMLPARLHATAESERHSAASVLTANQLRLVLHVEQHARRVPIVDPADLKQKLKKLVRAIDPHVKVVSTHSMQQLPWQVLA